MRKRIHKHRHKILTAFIFIILIIITMPLIEGIFFKRHYFNLINSINQDNRIKIEVLEYQEGWFHSHATIRILLNKALTGFYQIATSQTNDLKPIEFTIEENISHGPIVYDQINHRIEFGNAKIQSDFYLSEQLESLLLKDNKKQTILQLVMLAEFDGDWSGQIRIPALTFKIPNIGDLTWLGLNGSFKLIMLDKALKHMKVETKIESITLENADVNNSIKQFNIQPIKYKYDVAKIDEVFSGKTNLYTRGFSVTMANQSNLAADKFAIHTAFTMDPYTFYNANISINAKNVKMPNEAIPTISPLHILISASNFNTKELQNYLNSFKFDDQNAMNNVDLKILEGLLVHTITPISVVNGELSLDTAVGALTCYFKSTWRPDIPTPNTFSDIIASADIQINLIMAPGVVTKIIELYNGRINVVDTPRGRFATIKQQPVSRPSIIAQIPAQFTQQLIDQLVIAGYLSKDKNNNYITNMTIESGVLKMNDKAILSQ